MSHNLYQYSHKIRRRMRKSGAVVIFSAATIALCYLLAAATATDTACVDGSCVRTSERAPMKKIDDRTPSPPPPAVRYAVTSSGRDDVTRYTAVRPADGSKVSVRSWMELVSSDSSEGRGAAADLSEIIASSPYAGVLFEVQGASPETSRTVQFEFALVNRPSLKSFAEGSADPHSFSEHFRRCLAAGGERSSSPTCCSFENLGGDARLVSPLPQRGDEDDAASHSHLAAFVRRAPAEQVAEFWRLGASEYLSVLEGKDQRGERGAKTWFSTNGMGVAWLHLRLDDRPKYYSYAPFRD